MGKKIELPEKEVLWKDRKRTIFGLPLSFTRYRLYDDKLVVSKGFFSVVDDEVMLFRILDFKVKMSFWQRIFGVGTVVISSSDATHKELELLSIKQPRAVKQLISDNVMFQRKKNGVRGFDRISAVADQPDDIDDDGTEDLDD